MIRIALIAYKPSFGDLFAATLAEYNQQVSQHPYEQEDYQLETIQARDPGELEKRHLNADVLVARGLMADALQQLHDFVPVVEIPVTINDLLPCIHYVRRIPGAPRVGVFGSKNTTMGVDQLAAICGAELHAFTINSMQEVEEQIQLAASRGFSVAIGGIRCCDVAARHGLTPIVMHCSKESIWQTIREIRRFAYIRHQEREKAQSISRIVDQAFDGILALDPQRRLTLFNAAAQRLLGFAAKEVLGHNLADVLRKSPPLEVLERQDKITGEIIKHNGRYLAINKGPIELDGQQLGTLITLQDARHIQRLEVKIRHEINTRGHVAKHTFADIIGTSALIRHAIKVAADFSSVNSNILIVGQTGTGKELFAQSIHNQSRRRLGPFVAVNCASLPESLLESELFGYAPGAFTGAARDGKPGLFELAHRGTILLDEISEISAHLQMLLLRVLQEREVVRVGDKRVMPIDVRVIATTNKDLASLVAEKRFREDLFFRLDILRVFVPPLDARKEDIPLIADFWVQAFAAQLKGEERRLTEQAKRLLQSHQWPGNVRQLLNVCERLVVLSKSPLIGETDVELALMTQLRDEVVASERDPVQETSPVTRSASDCLQAVKAEERDQILDVLRRVRFSQTRAAKLLHMSRTTLWRRMRALGIPSRKILERAPAGIPRASNPATGPRESRARDENLAI